MTKQCEYNKYNPNIIELESEKMIENTHKSYFTIQKISIIIAY